MKTVCFKNNPDLKSAQAALLVARENTLAQRGAYYPSVSGSFSATRAKTSDEISPVASFTSFQYSLFTPEVSVSYTPDVFGLNRRTVESLKAQQEQARYVVAATNITLSSNVAAAAIQEASLRAQIDATNELIKINTNLQDVLREQFEKGYIGRLDVAAQEAQLAQVAATLPPLLKQLAQELPLSLPSKLVEQRPDVLQAEENLHSASALIGVARANRLPVFNLTGDIGSMALAFGNIFSVGNGFRDVTAGVTQPIFEGGTLMHKERAARAA